MEKESDTRKLKLKNLRKAVIEFAKWSAFRKPPLDISFKLKSRKLGTAIQVMLKVKNLF